MDLSFNEVIRIEPPADTPSNLKGFYRVVVDDKHFAVTVLVALNEESAVPLKLGGRPRKSETKHRRKKPRPVNVGTLLFTKRHLLDELLAAGHLKPARIEDEGRRIAAFHARQLGAMDPTWARRIEVMAPFLDIPALQDSILAHRSIAVLVRQVVGEAGVCTSFVYRMWSLLCRRGFSAQSLRPDFDRCGAPGVKRPCEPGGRCKAGRKAALPQKNATGEAVAVTQPGMSADWLVRILAADRAIPKPKPCARERYDRILELGFVSDYVLQGGKPVGVMPPLGTYPNRRQVRHALDSSLTKLTRLLEKTTAGHFERSHRGLHGKSWEDACGPGHTWAIDSTIGDIYLRSSLNLHWIIGRPIVYTIVDVWSTAVVGFYVCLAGPSWETARLAIFNAACDPQLMAQLWRCQWSESLHPAPTLPYALLCDRGEYLSAAAKETLLQLVPRGSYTPPYRPDLKGSVEVLHRIEKDFACNQWTPGAIDARRAEYELRKFDPTRSALTVQLFVQYLQVLFWRYNLEADRSARMDGYMAAAGVVPTPAGLWRYGHEIGIGFRRHIEQSQLISHLLPAANGTVVNGGIAFRRALYKTDDPQLCDWSTEARNIGRRVVPIFHYPGSVSRIWTPSPNLQGLICAEVSDQSQPAEATREELDDAYAYARCRKTVIEHDKSTIRMAASAKIQELQSAALTAARSADALATGKRPRIQEARQMELASGRASVTNSAPPARNDDPRSDALQGYLTWMSNPASPEEDGYDALP